MPNYQPEHDAPKLRKFLKNSLFNGKRVLLMRKMDWEQLLVENSGEFIIDIDITPMSKVTNVADVVGCLVKKSDANFILEVYRFDERDKKPYNLDLYEIHTSFQDRPDFMNIVLHASTDFDDNMQSFLDDCVIIETKPKDDHHRSYEELPEVIKLIINTDKTI